MDERSPIKIPIDGTLDLHTFDPRQIKSLVPEYLAACRQQGIFQVRIVHGKGKGVLQRTVHSILRKLPLVVSFHLAEQEQGSWGATIVEIKK